MKKSIKLVLCMLLVATIALPSVFATGLGSSSSIVKVGNVDTTDVNYNVDIEWGDMIFNFVKSNVPGQEEYYIWEPNTESSQENQFKHSGDVRITNRSTVAVNMDVLFSSNIEGVMGLKNEMLSGTAVEGYRILSEKPEDWETGRYYEIGEGTYTFTRIEEGTEFIADTYYEFAAGGGGPLVSSQISGVTVDDENIIYIESATWNLSLEGGSLANVRPGATIGTLTVTLS